MRIMSMSNTDAAAALLSLPAAEHLPDDPAILKSMILELLATLHQEQRDNAALRQRLDLLWRRLSGPRSERFDPNQALLFGELAPGAGGEAPAPPEPEAKPKS